MKKIYEHRLADLLFDEKASLLEEIWKTETEHASDEDYVNFQLAKLEVVKKILPRLFLCDIRDLRYTISVEMQAWTDKNVTTFWDSTPLEKCAFIVSKEMIVQLSLEMTMDESTHKYDFKYFSDLHDAVKWLTN